ncbi:MAG TPA: dihydrolipoamide acetyltransferase family protein [Candidatus Binataceae bacterium]|nr:dihydrolipoamide acetyltransferase family protein [Candidatus Binataceae bacterium]
MAVEVTMPQMGESVVEGTVTKWLVKAGESVREDQPLCEISTDKVDTEIPSPGTGVIARLVANEGQTLPIGALLAVIETAAEAPGPAKPARAPAAAAKATTPAPIARVAAEALPAVSPVPLRVAPTGAPPRRYSPVVLRIAEDRGVDLNLVPGTGIGGRVSKRDVERYLEALERGQVHGPPHAEVIRPAAAGPIAPPAAAAPPAARVTPPGAAPAAGVVFRAPVYQPRDGDIVEPFTRRRKIIAEHMVYSKTHAPHVGTVAEVDLTKVMALREAHKDAFRNREGFALTLLPFAAMATVRALKEFRRMNASVAGDSVIIRKDINLGIAMDAEEGLLVPVIKGAEGLSVVGLAREIERLHRKVLEKSLTADDLSGGSFTLSNPGREGNLYGFAIINQPQVGILRMGEVKKRPVVIEVDGSDALAVRTMMYLALSYDHRVIDGVLGNRFLFRTSRILEEADFEL